MIYIYDNYHDSKGHHSNQIIGYPIMEQEIREKNTWFQIICLISNLKLIFFSYKTEEKQILRKKISSNNM